MRPRRSAAWVVAGVGGAALLIALLLAAGGCGGGDPRPEGSATAPPAGGETPRRIVSLSPNVSELLFALGLGERMVGVDDYTRLPAAAAAVPRLGGFLDPDRERLVALHPDLVVLLESQARLGEEIERLGIGVLVVDNQSLADVESSIAAIARRAGVPAAGEQLVARLRHGLAPRPVAVGRRVVVSVGSDPGRPGESLVAGPRSFHGELLRRLGADNVFADLAVPYAMVSAEELVGRRPDAVLELHAGELSAAARAEIAAGWHRLLGPGVAVAVIDGDDVLIPGPDLPRLYARMAAALAPAAAEAAP